jgi:hypothetical protein
VYYLHPSHCEIPCENYSETRESEAGLKYSYLKNLSIFQAR